MSKKATANATTGGAAAVLVVGATGATGKHVVSQLLDRGHRVKVIVRSEERMLEALRGGVSNNIDENKQQEEQRQQKQQDQQQPHQPPNNDADEHPLLTVTEASLLDMSDDELRDQVDGVHAVVCCLGHNLTFGGIWGHPRRLVTDSVRRLTDAMMRTNDNPTTEDEQPKRFVLMGSDGVAHPAGTDDERSLSERTVLFLLRNLLPPHADNERAADYLFRSFPRCGGGGSNGGDDEGNNKLEWTVIRPTDLQDGPVTPFTLLDKPAGSLFGSGIATRSNVAACVVEMIRDDKQWLKYKFQMPVLVDEEQ